MWRQEAWLKVYFLECAFKVYYALEFLTRSSVGIMVYFPFEFRFPGTNGHIENGRTNLRSRVVGRSGEENSPCAASADVMGVAAAQIIEPDPKPAPTNGKFSFGVHVPGGLGIQGKTVVLLINYLL